MIKTGIKPLFFNLGESGLVFSIPLEPVAKQRARVLKSGRSYTPKRTKDFETALVGIVKELYKGEPLVGPLKLSVIFFVKKPKKPKCLRPITRPDLDNYIKSINDSLNNILWIDDSQICEIRAKKSYSKSGGPWINFLIKKIKIMGG